MTAATAAAHPDKMPSPLREAGPASKIRGAQKVFQTKSLPVGGRMVASAISDDEPIYDYVASDDDYYQIPETTPGKNINWIRQNLY
jgi:hypothetical protein